MKCPCAPLPMRLCPCPFAHAPLPMRLCPCAFGGAPLPMRRCPRAFGETLSERTCAFGDALLVRHFRRGRAPLPMRLWWCALGARFCPYALNNAPSTSDRDPNYSSGLITNHVRLRRHCHRRAIYQMRYSQDERYWDQMSRWKPRSLGSIACTEFKFRRVIMQASC